MILTFDAAWAGLAWVLYDKRIVRKGWRAFRAETRTLIGLRDWLDESLLPHARGVDRVLIETTNVFAPGDRAFMLQYQSSVIVCAQSVAMWCVCMDLPEPEFVLPATWRAAFKGLMPKPRPRGADEWKQWAQRVVLSIHPDALDGLGKKAKEDVSDAVLLAIYGS